MKKVLDEYAVKIANAQKAFEANSAARAGIGKNIGALSDQIKTINASIKEVQNISMQVKILSLNASVEAARAGVAGKGFAVVASEISRLSQSTDATAKKIEDDVNHMKVLLDNTVADMTKAKSLGDDFERQLEMCVVEAHGFSQALTVGD